MQPTFATRMVRGFLSRFSLQRPQYHIVRSPLSAVSPKRRLVPEHIIRPPYAALVDPVQPKAGTGEGVPPVLSAGEVDCVREACKITRDALDYAEKELAMPGVRAEEIDAAVHDFIVQRGAYPSPLGYLGFPKSLCTSVNNVVCHGIPDARALEAGDILSIDVTSYVHGFHGDSCRTVVVGGNTDAPGMALVKAAYDCLHAAIGICRAGEPYSSIGATISKLARARGFSVCREFIGHGVGRQFHCPPQILHYANQQPGVMQANTVFTIEPCILEHGRDMLVLEDGWTAVTADNGRAAQFEHTVLITEQGCEILTKSEVSRAPPE